MPQVTRTFPTTIKPVGRFAYLRIHAYGLFLGGLVTAIAAVVLADPARTDLAQYLGRVPAGLLAWNWILLVGGLQILIGSIWRYLRAELVGLAFVVVSVLWSTFGAGRVYGWTSKEFALGVLFLVITVGTSALRASALLAPETLYVVYPGRRVHLSDRTELILGGSAEPASNSHTGDSNDEGPS